MDNQPQSANSTPPTWAAFKKMGEVSTPSANPPSDYNYAASPQPATPPPTTVPSEPLPVVSPAPASPPVTDKKDGGLGLDSIKSLLGFSKDNHSDNVPIQPTPPDSSPVPSSPPASSNPPIDLSSTTSNAAPPSQPVDASAPSTPAQDVPTSMPIPSFVPEPSPTDSSAQSPQTPSSDSLSKSDEPVAKEAANSSPPPAEPQTPLADEPADKSTANHSQSTHESLASASPAPVPAESQVSADNSEIFSAPFAPLSSPPAVTSLVESPHAEPTPPNLPFPEANLSAPDTSNTPIKPDSSPPAANPEILPIDLTPSEPATSTAPSSSPAPISTKDPLALPNSTLPASPTPSANAPAQTPPAASSRPGHPSLSELIEPTSLPSTSGPAAPVSEPPALPSAAPINLSPSPQVGMPPSLPSIPSTTTPPPSSVAPPLVSAPTSPLPSVSPTPPLSTPPVSNPTPSPAPSLPPLTQATPEPPPIATQSNPPASPPVLQAPEFPPEIPPVQMSVAPDTSAPPSPASPDLGGFLSTPTESRTPSAPAINFPGQQSPPPIVSSTATASGGLRSLGDVVSSSFNLLANPPGDSSNPPYLAPVAEPQPQTPPQQAAPPPAKKPFPIWPLVGGVALALVLIGVLAYLFISRSGGSASTNPSTLGATTSENQAILASALGPSSWENNFSNSLLPVERGGLRLEIASPVSPASTSSPPPSDIKSLLITISKAEVHLDTQTAVAKTSDISATQSASRSLDRWETLRLDRSDPVDIVDLRHHSSSQTLGITYLAAGRYSELRLYVTSAVLTTSSGEKFALNLTPQNAILKATKPFDITSTATVPLTAALDPSSMIQGSAGNYQFTPALSRLLYNGNPI